MWSASALSGSDIWVVGFPLGSFKGNFRIVVKHWSDPGTTSLWGAGGVIVGTPPNIHGNGAILKYGN